MALAAIPFALALTMSAAARQGEGCQFVRGFSEMRQLLGGDVIGNCVENERLNMTTKNIEQRATGGRLVYRALDGLIAFEAGGRTWINGPAGLVERPSDLRFEWEGDRLLVEALRGGGYVIFWRHARTDQSQSDTEPQNLANCATQRNLNEPGRQQARALGEAFRTLGIPVGAILSSPYCRTRESAELAFGRFEVEASLTWTYDSDEQRNAYLAQVRSMVITPPATGSNTVLVSHVVTLTQAVGANVSDVPVEGQAAIMDPTAGRPLERARLLAEDWFQLAAAQGPHLLVLAATEAYSLADEPLWVAEPDERYVVIREEGAWALVHAPGQPNVLVWIGLDDRVGRLTTWREPPAATG